METQNEEIVILASKLEKTIQESREKDGAQKLSLSQDSTKPEPKSLLQGSSSSPGTSEGSFATPSASPTVSKPFKKPTRPSLKTLGPYIPVGSEEHREDVFELYQALCDSPEHSPDPSGSQSEQKDVNKNHHDEGPSLEEVHESNKARWGVVRIEDSNHIVHEFHCAEDVGLTDKPQEVCDIIPELSTPPSLSSPPSAKTRQAQQTPSTSTGPEKKTSKRMYEEHFPNVIHTTTELGPESHRSRRASINSVYSRICPRKNVPVYIREINLILENDRKINHHQNMINESVHRIYSLFGAEKPAKNHVNIVKERCYSQVIDAFNGISYQLRVFFSKNKVDASLSNPEFDHLVACLEVVGSIIMNPGILVLLIEDKTTPGCGLGVYTQHFVTAWTFNRVDYVAWPDDLNGLIFNSVRHTFVRYTPVLASPAGVREPPKKLQSILKQK